MRQFVQPPLIQQGGYSGRQATRLHGKVSGDDSVVLGLINQRLRKGLVPTVIPGSKSIPVLTSVKKRNLRWYEAASRHRDQDFANAGIRPLLAATRAADTAGAPRTLISGHDFWSQHAIDRAQPAASVKAGNARRWNRCFEARCRRTTMDGDLAELKWGTRERCAGLQLPELDSSSGAGLCTQSYNALTDSRA